MVVIGLIGLLATVLTVGSTRLLLDRKESPHDVFWSAVGEARKYALQHETEVFLSFDNQGRMFKTSTALGTKECPLPGGGMEFELEFLGMAKGARSIMIAGTLLETDTIEGVKFFVDGTCTPFRAQLVLPGKHPVVFEIDPWTCAPMLQEEGNS